MKKNILFLFKCTLVCLFIFSSCLQKGKETIIIKGKEKATYKKEGKNPKKGIEYIADYQLQIRKGLDEEKSTYKKGYLITEFNKAKKNLQARKATNLINPIFIERGPFNVPGRTRGIAVDPTNARRWFAGSVGGGVWLTENEGLTWSNLTDFQIPNLATSTIEISKNNPNTLYVGTGEPFGNIGAIGGSGLFKTTNGGTTWQHLLKTNSFGSIGRILVNPKDENNVIVGAQGGIYRTIDGGLNWTKTFSSGSGAVQDLDAHPLDFNIQYGSVNSLGLVKSIDNGVSWTTVFDGVAQNPNHRRFETAVSPADPTTIFISAYSNSNATVGENTDFYVSINSGTTFTNLQTDGSTSAANLLTGQGWYNNVIMAHPYNPNVFYVGGVALFKVTIEGNKFTSTSIASGYYGSEINVGVHVDQHGLFTILGSNGEFKILLANDGGVYSTTMKQDPGVIEGDWSDTVVGKNSTQFYGADKQNGQDNYLAGAQDNGTWIAQGNDATKSKIYQNASGGDGFETIWHYNNPQDIITSSQTNVFYRFTNFVRSQSYFSESSDSSKSPFYTKLANANNNPNVVFAVSASGVWRSIDFAANWNLISIPNNFASGPSSSLNIKVSTADPNIVWTGAAMTEAGAYALFVSQDNGQTFSKTASFINPTRGHNLLISGLGTSYIEKNRAYALFSSQGAAKILKTEDLGETWVDISGFSTGTSTGFPDVAVHSILEMPFDKNIIWAGTDIGLFETVNGGTSWRLVSELPSVAVYDMKVVNDQVVIATYGRGIWSATISELNSYTMPSYLTFATATTAQKEVDDLRTMVSYTVPTNDIDKVKIFIDNIEQSEIVQDFSTGVTYVYETISLEEGHHQLGIQVFDTQNNIQTSISNQEFVVINFENADSNIGIAAFKNTDVFIYKSDFKIDDLNSKVSDVVLNNADHPYENSKTYLTVLKKPLIISESNRNFSYEDMAIVEPYTDDLLDLTQFYDYVEIEASSDLKTWKTLDKYDARRFPEWLAEFNKGTNAAASDGLFKTQTIVLTEKGFSIGDTIVIRFKLVTDPGATSFGWAIRSINKATASVGDVLTAVKSFTIYPTISKGNFTVFAKNTLGKSKLSIFDLTGKEVHQRAIHFEANQKHKVSVHLNAGVYIVNIIDENNKKSSNKIIIE